MTVSARSQPKLWAWALPYACFYAVVAAILLTRDNTSLQRTVDGAGYGLIVLLGIGYSLRASTHPALHASDRRPWRYLALSLFLLLLGGAGYTASLHTDSARLSLPLLLAVLCRVLFLIVLFRALTLFERRRVNRTGTVKVVLNVITIAAGGLMVTWFFVVGPALTRNDIGTIIWSTSLGSTVGDLLLVFAVATLLLRGASTTARTPLILLLIGCVGYLANDVYLTDVGARATTRSLPSSAWLTIAALIPVVMFLSAAVEQDRLASRPTYRPARLLGRRPPWLPFAVLLVGYVPMLIAASREPVYPWWGLVAGIIVMTLAVAGRQVISLRENERLVVTDSLTGLSSRVHLHEVLRRSTHDNPDLVAVLHIDLDSFKRINNVYGHETGDTYLAAFAGVLRSCTRTTDVAARVGGDEFVVILNGLQNTQQAVTVAERILATAAVPKEIDGHQLAVRASIGIAAAPGSTVEPDQILHWADQAMYVAKRRQTHGWQLWAEGLLEDDRENTGRLLAVAGPRGELRLAYQPIVALATGDLVGCEALVRWEHPTRGLVPPLEFIPIAEEYGSIHDIGRWVVDEASRQMRRWRDLLPAGRPWELATNISPRQLSYDTLASDILDILNRNGFPARDVIAEVTESGVVEDGTAVNQLELLRARGVRIALDDFGTGYSSLRYLTRFPVNVLKLDRCFVAELNQRPDGSAVAEAVLRLATMMHLETVAEGVETAAQANELTLFGYHNAQGMYYSAPLWPDEMDELIRSANGGWPNLGPGHPGPASGRPGGAGGVRPTGTDRARPGGADAVRLVPASSQPRRPDPERGGSDYAGSPDSGSPPPDPPPGSPDSGPGPGPPS